ncbi:MAG: hydroxyisourate hydrolase [Labrys sp. (in: a-proteobacteria)]
MAGRLTTHVLDTAAGRPAANMRILLRRAGDETVIVDCRTNADGRVDKPLLDGGAFVHGTFELTFFVADYFRDRGVSLPATAFLDQVPIRFGISEQAHYHVPLLVSPYGYSTYRGS